MAEKKLPLRERITQQIVEAVKGGLPPWRQPWAAEGMAGSPCNVTGRKYNGINVLLLWMTAASHGLTSRFWGTMGQWNQINCWVSKKPPGVQRWGTAVVFFSLVEDKKDDKKTPPKGKPKLRPMTKYFVVFNADQVEPPNIEMLADKPIEYLNRLAKRFLGKTYPPRSQRKHIAQLLHDDAKQRLEKFKVQRQLTIDHGPDFGPAEELMAASGADIRHGGDKAFYAPDYILLPPKRLFDGFSHYYETAFHELAHWASVSKRLDIEDKGYAFGELVAEISACFVAAEIGVPMAEAILPENQKYINTWLSRMGSDPRFIFEAAKYASKVTDYLLAFKQAKQRATG